MAQNELIVIESLNPDTILNTNALEEFEVTWRYQHFETSGVNF